MLISIAYILILGLLFGYICKFLKLPSLIGISAKVLDFSFLYGS